MKQYPVERLLRPAIEIYPTTAYFCGAALAVAAPSALMMTPGVAYSLAAISTGLGMWRLRDWRRLRRYQKSMSILLRYSLRADEIPVSDKRLFLGMGFPWKPKHTQRLWEARRNDAEKYIKPPWLVTFVRKFEIEFERTPVLGSIAKITSIDHRLNPLRPAPEIGGNPALHAVGLLEGEHTITMPLSERVAHTLVLGTTRVGKTRFAETLITQDIQRGDSAVIIFDPKGDAGLLRRAYQEAVRAGRGDRFFMFHLGFPELSARYNPVGNFARVTEIASRIAGQLPGEGQSATFREFTWRHVNTMAKALTAMGRTVNYDLILLYGQDIDPLVADYMEFLLKRSGPDSWPQRVRIKQTEIEDNPAMAGVPKAMRDRNPRTLALMQVVKTLELSDIIAHSLFKTMEYDRVFFDKLVASLLPLMEKLTTGRVSELLSPDYTDTTDKRPIFDWPEIIRTGSIVYVALDALTDAEVAGAVGNSMFADLTSYAGQLYKYGQQAGLPDSVSAPQFKVNIHADEFNELIGDEFIPLLNKAGGAGYQVTVYTQTWSDVEARLKSKPKAGQVAGNLNTTHMLRVQEEATAELLTKRLREVEVHDLMDRGGYTDAAPGEATHFKSTNMSQIGKRPVPMLEPGDLTNLPKGQAFSLLEGGDLHKIRIPLPDTSREPLPPSLEQMANHMKQNYTTSSDWFKYKPSWSADEGIEMDMEPGCGVHDARK